MKLPLKVHSPKRGAGILTVLTASSLLLLLGLTVAGTSFHHLSVSNRLHHSQVARNLAEDCLAKGLAKVLAHSPPDANPPFAGVMRISNGDPLFESGVLTFDPTQLTAENAKLKNAQLVQSYNNIGSDTSITVPGTSITIPEHSIYLRAVGSDHGIEKCMEAVVWVPPFPYAIASGGKIQISGDSKVASVKDLADLGDPTKYLPGSMATNSLDPDEALKLDGTNILITGDVQSAGGADISTGAVIQGETRLHAGQVHIPTIDISSYDTSAKAGVTTFTSGTGPNQVEGFAYRSGDLNFNSGVTLNGGVVYVNGDLNINGPISGEGALIATGKLTINGAGQLDSNNKVALLSKDDMTLTGSSGAHLGASGLLYTEGKLKADYADISGSAAAPDEDIQFTNVNMVQDKTLQKVTVQVGATPELPDFGEAQFVAEQIVIPGASFSLNSLGFTSKIIAGPERFKDPVTGEYHLKVNYQTTDSSGNVRARTLTNAGPPPIYTPLTPDIYETIQDPQGHVYQTNTVTPSTVAPLALGDVQIKYKGITYPATDATPINLARQEVIDAMSDQLGGLTSTQLALINMQLDLRLKQSSLLDMFMVAQQNSGAVTEPSAEMLYYNEHRNDPPGEQVTFTMNPGISNASFVNLADRIRLLYWREVAQ